MKFFDKIHIYISFMLLKDNKMSFSAAQFLVRKWKHELMEVGNSEIVKFIENKLIKEKPSIVIDMLIAMLIKSKGCLQIHLIDILGRIGDDRAIAPILKTFFVTNVIDVVPYRIEDMGIICDSLLNFNGHPDVLGFVDGIGDFINGNGNGKEKIIFHVNRLSEIYHIPEFKDITCKQLEFCP